MPDGAAPRWLSMEAAAAYLSIKPREFRTFVASGILPSPESDQGGPMWWSDAIDAAMMRGADPHNPPAGYKPPRVNLPRGSVRTPLLAPAAIASAAMPPMPSVSGIYFLLRGEVVVYVGQATNIARRIAAHTGEKEFTAWAWEPCPVEALNARERAYLDALTPALNLDPETIRRRREKRDG